MEDAGSEAAVITVFFDTFELKNEQYDFYFVKVCDREVLFYVSKTNKRFLHLGLKN